MPKGKRLNIKSAEDFWQYIKVGNMFDCWEWQKGKTTAGYGQFFFPAYTHQYAHRFAFEVACGHPIPDGMHICHTCDNPACCNPVHLFMGTHTDNMRDKAAKGRASKVLTEFQVASIHQMYATGTISQQKLADMHGVNIMTINAILTGKAWKHVKAA